jgi:transglutaminase-like putative cysteine protease
MTSRNKKRLGIAVGAIAIIGGLVYFGRRQRQLAGLGLFKPKYRLVTKRYSPAPLVGSTESGGMRTEHRRSALMPIEERVASIQDLVYKGVQDPQMRKLALGITQHCPERDGTCEAKAVYDYVKGRVRYTGDIAPVKFGRNGPVEGIDLFQSPKRTNEFRGGDCDDHSALSATLLALNGITPRLRVVAETRRGEDSHIYAVAGLPKVAPTKWLALDSTLPGKNNFGVEMPVGRITDFDA